jgi:hypothetical protein
MIDQQEGGVFMADVKRRANGGAANGDHAGRAGQEESSCANAIEAHASPAPASQGALASSPPPSEQDFDGLRIQSQDDFVAIRAPKTGVFFEATPQSLDRLESVVAALQSEISRLKTRQNVQAARSGSSLAILRVWGRALEEGCRDGVKSLLDEHGDWLASAAPIMDKGRIGPSPLCFVAGDGRADLWDLLVSRGADPAGPPGQFGSPFMAAAFANREALARKAFAAAGPAAALAVNERGETALILAAGSPFTMEAGFAHWLVSVSDPAAVDERGRSALDVALRNDHARPVDLVEALAEAVDPSIPSAEPRETRVVVFSPPAPASPLEREIAACAQTHCPDWTVADLLLASPRLTPEKRAGLIRFAQGSADWTSLPRALALAEREAAQAARRTRI